MTDNIQHILTQVDSLKQELDSLRPIKPEFNKLITQKFQLEFNYHSNHIEGNTLTIGETKSLILRGSEVSIAKKFKDINEMKGHLEAYNTLGFLTERVLTPDFLPLELSQTFIKQLHKIIFVEDSKIHTDQGYTLIPAGDYKKQNNHVITNTGEVFEYAECTQVGQLMSDLIDWYNTNRSTIHPLLLATIFHYKFIRIHPFGDANGRTARLLMNLILQSSGYTLTIVKSDPDNKAKYLNSLSLTDNNFVDLHTCLTTDDVDLFEPFILEIADCLIKSFDIVIRGAKGEDITDADDVIKLAEMRVKDNKVFYSFKEVQNDQVLYKLATDQLMQVINLLQKYVNNVLKKLYFDVNVESEDTPFADFIVDEFYDMCIIARHSKVVNNFVPNSNLKIRFTLANGFISIFNKETSLDINFYYIDPDFDSKAKNLIQTIDNYFQQITQ